VNTLNNPSAVQNTTFDPRHHPVIGVDAHLPCVDENKLSISHIRQVLGTKGIQAHPEVFGDYKRLDPGALSSMQTKASVLFGIVDRPNPSVLLTLRSSQLRKHSGQIAFAGGRVDESDSSEVHTALREAQEEIGLEAHHVEVLGQLPEYLTGTGFLVTPVVAAISPQMILSPNPHEVTHTFEVPLSFLMNPSNHRRHVRELNGKTREWFSMPYQGDDQEWFIWGATAGMIRNLYQILINS
jgi:8-oxo-dGTP pyrophosphatase MutT (NUDIX family)